MEKKATTEQLAKMELLYAEVKEISAFKKDHYPQMVHFLQIVKDISIQNSFTISLEKEIKSYNEDPNKGSIKVANLMEQVIGYYK